ncbi:MAG: hypothetical protein ACE14M_08710 [Terriglobales bacterium]
MSSSARCSNTIAADIPYVHTGPWDTYNVVSQQGEVYPVTIGIGVLCDGGETAILASDMRVTYRSSTLPPTDAAGKQYDFAPLLLAAAVAGEPKVCHPVITEIAEQLRKLLAAKKEHSEQLLVFEHIRLIIEYSRKKELRKLQGCAMEAKLGVSLAEWQAGKLPNADKLDPLALQWGRTVLEDVRDKLRYSLGLILLGFVDNGPVFFRAWGAEPLDEAANPEFYAIGSGSEAALDVLIRREQNIYTTMARSLLHLYEALKAARQHEKTVGPPAPYIVIRPHNAAKPTGVMRFPAESKLLRGWGKAYRKRMSTESLDKDLPNVQVKHLLERHVPMRSQVLTDQTVNLESVALASKAASAFKSN